VSEPSATSPAGAHPSVSARVGLGELPTRPGAKSLLLTLLGEFVYPHGGSAWTSTIVRALETVDITERNARQAVARLGDQGIVEAERLGRRTRWHLTDRGTQLLATGSERIYSFGRRADAWDETWLLVICSIPESQRATRHQFRTQLTFEGFGFVAPTIAVSPHADREKAANDIVADLGLADTALTFRSASGSMTDDETVLRTAWDLEALAGEYATFIDTFGPEDRTDTPTHMAAMRSTLLLVDAWRRFPFVDPELPTALLPEEWVGTRAQQLFAVRHAAARPAALAYYNGLESAAA
jgi:phenylacetic acid degradation operon negative regulatory protein